MERTVVIGSGTMGCGIASLLASTGKKVLLLDLNKDIVRKSLEKIQNTHALTNLEYIANITPGTIDEDISKIKEADLVIEAIIEDINAKHSLYKKIEPHMRPNTIISSNTSTIQLKNLIEGRSDLFRKNFVITHFFNPPRYMKLLELVTWDETPNSIKNKLNDFLANDLGKEVVFCKDTPGFIANRIGCYFIEKGIEIALANKLDIYQFDQLMHIAAGLPKTGLFGLADLIGLDVMKLISSSLTSILPKNDFYNRIHFHRPLIEDLIARGYNGRKGNGGFYKVEKINGEKQTLVLDLEKNAYITPSPYKIKEDLKNLLERNDPVWQVLENTILYTLTIAEDITDNIFDIDRTIKYGYNWKFGPLEMIEQIGIDYFIETLTSKNIKIPSLLIKLKEGKIIPQVKIENHPIPQKILFSYQDSKLIDIGDNVLCFEILSKMNCLTENIFLSLQQAIDYAEKNNKKAIIIGDNDKNFSAGADLSYFYELIKAKNYKSIEAFLKLGQETMTKIKYSSVPIISAVKGVAFGGGCELMLHSHHICIYIDSKFGLVETNVGLVPGWGGIKEFYLRNKNEQNKNIAVQAIKTAQIFDNAELLKKPPFNIKNVKIIFNEKNILNEAKKLALTLYKNNFIKNKSVETIFENLNIGEQELFNLERDLFMQACKAEGVLDKLESVLYKPK